jgi:hypothetical protein
MAKPKPEPEPIPVKGIIAAVIGVLMVSGGIVYFTMEGQQCQIPADRLVTFMPGYESSFEVNESYTCDPEISCQLMYDSSREGPDGEVVYSPGSIICLNNAATVKYCIRRPEEGTCN